MELDRAALEAVGRFEVRTDTPWDDGIVPLRGAAAARYWMAHAGRDGAAISEGSGPETNIRASCRMMTSADIDVILAVRKNGAYMPVSDKGPAFILYPYDSSPRLRDRVYYARSVWQVAQIRPAQEDAGAQ